MIIKLNENDIKNLLFNTLKLYLNEAKLNKNNYYSPIIKDYQNYLDKWDIDSRM